MVDRYLGRIPLRLALEVQEESALHVQRGMTNGILLGFESEPTISVGHRSSSTELTKLAPWTDRGYAVETVSRGGQVTIHNPGQLVIFPIFNVRKLGVKKWIQLLALTTQQMASEQGKKLFWDESAPGLYSERGKVVSMGFRVQGGISTHGISINITNNLNPFGELEICGRCSQAVDRLDSPWSLPALFESWVEKFKLNWRKVDKPRVVEQVSESVRL